jgi:hypothetical protein
MLKRKPIDTYIRRATAGLPRLERVDTAAEIRVHLLQKTRELMAQGFPKEEAEHLAVQEMGPVAATNRALIGHMFTSSLGWVVVGCMLAGVGVWTYLERDWIFWKDTTIRAIPLNTDDLQLALPDIPKFETAPKLSKFEFYLPRGTKTLEYALITQHAHRATTIFSTEKLQRECAAQNACTIATDQLERIPFKASIIVGEGQQSETTLQPYDRKWEFRSLFSQNQVTPNIRGITMGGTTRTWKTYEKIQNPLFYTVNQNQLNETHLTMNTWTPIYGADIRRFKNTRDNAGNYVLVNLDPKKITWDNLVVAVRASDRLESQLAPSRLRTAVSGAMGVTETTIAPTEVQQDPWREEGVRFSAGLPQYPWSPRAQLGAFVASPNSK